MKTRWLLVSSVGLAAILILLAGQRPVVGQGADAAAEAKRLVGTWNVTLQFPQCSSACACPGGVPNIPIPALQTYLQDGSILEVSGGSPLRGPALGSWQHLGQQQFGARFKFFLFNPDGSRRGSEVITDHIDLTGPDAFQAIATFDLFDAVDNVIEQGCPINETARRFE